MLCSSLHHFAANTPALLQLHYIMSLQCMPCGLLNVKKKKKKASDGRRVPIDTQRWIEPSATDAGCQRCRGAVHLADMNDCSQRLGFHAAAIFAQAGAAGTGRPFDIHLTSKCLLSRSLLSSLLVSPPSVTRPFILRHDFWPERFCCSTYLPFSSSFFFSSLQHISVK